MLLYTPVTAVIKNDGRGTVNNISEPAQGVWSLGQGHMPGYPGGLRHETLETTHPLRILGQYSDGGLRGEYYREDFKYIMGVTQVYSLPPTIFNVVVDSVVSHWISLLTGGAGGQDGWVREVRHRIAFF